jgi:sugar/nucleoside kinase (ribokinase family)
MQQIDFLAIGDCTVDEFIKLKDAQVHCDIDNANCTISMSWGDKIPYESSELVAGVGNAANAAVAAARLGLATAFMTNIGADDYGKKILATYKQEGIDCAYVRVHENIPTNHHYVLRYGAERTILIRHEQYPYRLPEDLTAPRWMYLSSAGETSEVFHLELATWLAAHPETKLAFQPGTFQMEMGKEKLAPLYAVTELVACNKEEAERILRVGVTPIEELLKQMHALGPKTVLITDGPNGAYVSDGAAQYKITMYPDPKEPVDRTGAGDATTSTFVAALALGKSIEEALQWGPINSMSVVQFVGAQEGLLTRAKLEEYLTAAPTDYKPQLLS